MSTRRYRVRHETCYIYGGDVAHSHHLLHLSPRSRDNQRCLGAKIVLDPTPSFRRDDQDAFGNPVTRLEYDRPHHRLSVCAEIDVDVSTVAASAAGASDAWESVVERLRYSGTPMAEADVDAMRFRMQSGYVVLKQAFADYGDDCFTPGAAIADAAEGLMRKIYREFRYAPGATTISTAMTQVFESRRGVCQDFAHVMIAVLRSRGLAARYVSGYLRTIAAGAAPVLVGADASHAWVSVYCPPLGWIDLDPTNDVRVGTDHITLAWGRDFGDVSPLRGVIVGGGGHDFSVRVSVQPLES
jgi:transglutaminase-like putative cysteine protease